MGTDAAIDFEFHGGQNSIQAEAHQAGSAERFEMLHRFEPEFRRPALVTVRHTRPQQRWHRPPLRAGQ